KATWLDRAWLVAGSASLLITFAKVLCVIFAGSSPENPLLWPKLTAAAVIGYLLADLCSGIYHWAVDNYGGAATPIFGPQIESFRAHHQRPSEITKVETAGILSILAAAITVAMIPVNVFLNDAVLLAFFLSFGGCGMFSLKFHAWAHTPRRRLPPLVAALQDAGVLLSPSHHAAHHRPPYRGYFCTVNGVSDWVLDKGNILAAAEVAIFRSAGVRPRSWEEPGQGW
ncbi:hypothetical protein M569_06530, partial [Genlisea aurea]